MDGSAPIQVVKCGGELERFDAARFAAALHRAMRTAGQGRYDEARQLALAVKIYLQRSQRAYVPSAAVFEMGVRVLRRVGLHAAGEAMEVHRLWRRSRRARLRIVHAGGKRTLWDKDWLSELAQRTWGLARRTGRILADEVEAEMLAGLPAGACGEGSGCREVSRDEVQQRLNRCVSAWGLAEPVPVRA
ncbi:MAG: hypothetical protein ACOC8F_07630 [Planctomycetota bacterium]